LPVDLVIKMIEPLFTSKLRYGLELVINVIENLNDVMLKRMHSLHRQAMKAALRMKRTKKIEDGLLLTKTGQRSVLSMALSATAILAWKTAMNWKGHPLTQGRIEGHLGGKKTRQATNRDLPPQSTGSSSLISRVVEVWERLPREIREEKKESVVKTKIKQWSDTYINLL